uniref:Peptidase M12A domain-containing protein n=1 Tax=Cuerna arida TaxID=1464854 RepID=A0A1B6FXQ9_9HEMI
MLYKAGTKPGIRDCYIAVTDKGAKDAHANRHFTTVPTDMKFPYDVNSVMQYRLSDAFVSLQGEKIGPIGEDPSWQDWRKINYLYCGGKHICQDHRELCLRHKDVLRKCIRDGRMREPSDQNDLRYIFGEVNW